MNRNGQAVGPSSQKLSSFLGTIARNSMVCPLNYEDWRDMPETTKADQMAYIKNLSNIGKKSRAQQKGFHTCGSKSFANKAEEKEELLADVGKIEFYRITHTLKNVDIVDEEAKRILNEAEVAFEKYKQENLDSSTKDLLKVERKIMSEVRGSERSGLVRGLGLEPSPISIGISKASSRKNGKLKKVKKELEDLKGADVSCTWNSQRCWIGIQRHLQLPPLSASKSSNLCSAGGLKLTEETFLSQT